MTKAEIRREMRQRLKKIAPEVAEKSGAICRAISAHPIFRASKRVALFSALPSEPNLSALWEHGEKVFCYPRVAGEVMEFVEVASVSDLAPTAWNPWILEPAGTEVRIISPLDIELILVPGLAFTRDGSRLGRGGGYYDRFLTEVSEQAAKIGVCFETQISESLPTEPHDQRMHAVITEAGDSAPLR